MWKPILFLFQVPTASVYVEGGTALNRVRWAHSGKEIATGDSEGQVQVYDVGEVRRAPRPSSRSPCCFSRRPHPPVLVPATANLRAQGGRVDALRQDPGGDQRESRRGRRAGECLMRRSSRRAAPNCRPPNSGFQLFHLLLPRVGLRRLAGSKRDQDGFSVSKRLEGF